MRDVSSPIDGFTTSNSNGTDRKKGSPSSDRPEDTSTSSIVLSKPTEIVRSRPIPKQRKRVDGDMRDPANLDASGGSSVLGEAQSSGPRPVMDNSPAAAANSVGGVSGSRARSITPPLKSKTTVVYTKRSINSKKRKILLSDSESEEDEVVPPTIDQRVLSASALTLPAEPTKIDREQKAAEVDRPSKKNRTVEDSARHERDSSVDPLDMEYVDPLRTPLKNQVVVEIDSVAKSKDTSADDEHNDDDVVVVLPSASKSKSKGKAKGRRAQYDDDDDDDEDPFEGLPVDAAMAESDEEDDFVPSGRKQKAAAKKKKAPPKKEKKAAKGKKAASTATPVEATPAISIGSEAMDVDIVPDEHPAPADVETTQTPPTKKGTKSIKATKGKATTSTQSTTKSSTVPEKSAEFIESGDDEEEVEPTASTSSIKGKGKAGVKTVESKGKVAKDDSQIKNKAKIVGSDDEEDIHVSTAQLIELQKPADFPEPLFHRVKRLLQKALWTIQRGQS
jgi:hypothetical protein